MFEERAATAAAAKTCLFIEDGGSGVGAAACFLFFLNSLFLSDGPFLTPFVAGLFPLSLSPQTVGSSSLSNCCCRSSDREHLLLLLLLRALPLNEDFRSVVGMTPLDERASPLVRSFVRSFVVLLRGSHNSSIGNHWLSVSHAGMEQSGGQDDHFPIKTTIAARRRRRRPIPACSEIRWGQIRFCLPSFAASSI